MEKETQIIIYKTNDGKVFVDTLVTDETIWMSQKMMAELFDVEVNTINYHLQEVFKTGELDENSVIRKFRITASDGKNYDTNHYNLDMIISIGYRVNSLRGTQFRIWATQRIREYLLQGFSLNENKLKSGSTTEYFDKLQSVLREIRLSERVFYQKIKDIYTTSIDYDASTKKSIDFFSIIQNKLLWAISSQTAAEIVYLRVDAKIPF